MDILMFALSFGLGLFLVIQAPMNGGLTKSLTKNTYSTCAIIFLLGSGFMLLIAILSGAPLPDFANQSTVWWMWLGGVLGAAYVTITTIATPKVGSTVIMVMVIVGRVIFATLIDTFGWVGVAQHATDWPRLAGIALVVVGAVLVGTAKTVAIHKDTEEKPSPAPLAEN